MAAKKNNSGDNEKLIRHIKQYKFVTIFLAVLFVGQNLLALAELPARLFNVPSLYLSSNQARLLDIEKRMNQLKTGVPIQFVNSLFGEPKFSEDFYGFCSYDENGNIDKNCSENSKSKLYVYEEPEYVVKAIVDDQQKVFTFSISSRNKNFRPKIQVFFGRFVDMNEIQLGKTLFSELPIEGDDTWLHAFREGFVSGTGNDNYTKFFLSGDYASSDFYIFETGFNRLERDISYFKCPGLYQIIEGDIPAVEVNDSTDKSKIKELEDNCVITSLKVVANEEGVDESYMKSLAFSY